MELKIGPYRAVYEAHRKTFLSRGFSETEAAGLAQCVVARPLPEVALSFQSAYYEEKIPEASQLLEYDQYCGICAKVQEAVSSNRGLFLDEDDPSSTSLWVDGVYPGLVVVRAIETGCWYAAEWTLEAGSVAISNVREITTYYENLALGVTESLLPALDLVQYAACLPLEVGCAYLAAQAAGQGFKVDEVEVDGSRPVQEMGLYRYLQATKVLSESQGQGYKMPAGILSGERTRGQNIAMLALYCSELGDVERQCFEARIALARTLSGRAWSDKAMAVQMVEFAKSNFSRSDAESLAKRLWGGQFEETDSSYRFRPLEIDACVSGTLREVALKEGLKVTLALSKAAPKFEQRVITEAGDYTSMAGHKVHLDSEKVSEGDLDHISKQIKAHNRFGDKLEKDGFSKTYDGYSKPHGNGYETKVHLTGGKAHVGVARFGEVHHVVGSAGSGPELDDHIAAAEAKSKKLPAIAGYETVGA